MKQAFQLINIQLKEFYREPAILFWAFVFPIAMAGILGIAFKNRGSEEVKIAILENSYQLEELKKILDSTRDKNEKSKEKTLASDSDKLPSLKFLVLSKNEAIRDLKRGKLNVIVERTQGGKIRFFFDTDNPNGQRDYLLILAKIRSRYTDFELQVDRLDSKGVRYIDYLVPGMLAMGVMNSCLWGVGWNLIEMRMKKLLRRMSATPMSKLSFLISFFFTRLIVTTIESVILLGFTLFTFENALEGSFGAIIMIFLSGNFAFSCIGIFVGSRAANSQVGNGLINAVTFPMMILSGVFFSYQNFPEIVLPIIKNLPLTLMADSLRTVFIEGAGFISVIPAVVGLFVYGIVFLFVGNKIFRWS
ncbi:ABC-2 family transporter protein [Leptospira weilii str. 2006001853]|uniref:ABC-2 family transporter protein n=2 Tax=Leptospira weilii TaxID=28184 RepID=A0A828Z8P8_9LEPT|nr:ABC transporter permease [Leptospira weilii]EMM74248.1 ABC-2 family transporter protein [Leptospira weilii str. 2006001855]EKR66676.1 ABC-2 family transporter protein [Leptospira weilii str. 2006001853]EMN45947.1 ABC-2 family transporter protein [Leptospira weilii str. LNT 1234]QDK21489.1 ABC transporter permease [Leptospira weilii]QDK25453.1 ABC transporter permease [Leptospira weilii]